MSLNAFSHGHVRIRMHQVHRLMDTEKKYKAIIFQKRSLFLPSARKKCDQKINIQSLFFGNYSC